MLKKIIALIFFVTASLVSQAQCPFAIQISSSDTAYLQLYHAAFFNIPSGFENVCEWEVTTFSGNVIYQDTTSGDFVDQSFVLFNHSVPISDSIKVTLTITNDVTPIACTVSDTIYWKQTEVIPGVFIGNWDVLSGNVGVQITTSSNEVSSIDVNEINLFPSPVQDYFQIEGNQDNYNLTIFNLNGQILKNFNGVQRLEKVDISSFSSGLYFVQFRDENNKYIGIKKIVKI